MASEDICDPALAEEDCSESTARTNTARTRSCQEDTACQESDADRQHTVALTSPEQSTHRDKTSSHHHVAADDNSDVFLPTWIRINFPNAASEDELRRQCVDTSQHDIGNHHDHTWTYNDDVDIETQQQRAQDAEQLACEECGSRRATLVCVECEQRLCFMCTDAIHIIPSLAMHSIELLTSDAIGSPPSADEVSSESLIIDVDTNITAYTTAESVDQSSTLVTSDDLQTHPLPPALPITSPRGLSSESLSLPAVAPSLNEHGECREPRTTALRPRYDPTTQVESRAHLRIGTHVFFRADDAGRWSRELLHGTVVHDASVRANAQSAFYYRVLWLRGVQVLPNGFFRASLELHNLFAASLASLSTLPPTSHWPQEIGLFPTQLGALRAVVTAEAVARGKFRRELVSGRLDITSFPSEDVLCEILDETDDALGAEFHVRLTKADDVQFLDSVGRGAWDFRAWMRTLGREKQLKEEDATTRACSTVSLTGSNNRKQRSRHGTSASDAPPAPPWQPAGRMRFYLVEQRELVFPDVVRTQHLTSILLQLLHVYFDYAWQRWRKFVKRSRRHAHRQRRRDGAMRIQQWLRRRAALRTSDASDLPVDASLLSLQLFQRRQVEAAKLYRFMTTQLQAKQRSALQRWAVAAHLDDLDVRRRLDVHEQSTWHPSFGITGLPKLPRVFVHKRSDGSVVIDDLKLYKQFRSNHAGPTDVSYWVVRARVLAGIYPLGASFRDARRIVARADYTTSVLLQEISVFICLAEAAELEAFEQMHVASTLIPAATATATASRDAFHTPWRFERVVRSKYDALQLELRAAVKMTQRQVQLAQAELDSHDASDAAATPAASSKDAATATTGVDDAKRRETLANKLVLVKQSAEKARRALETLTMDLQFAHYPIPRDNVPPTSAIETLMQYIEDALRAKRNVYVFSMSGHGRTGFVAAMLLGRLYGISSLDALERAQRLHDCQWSMHSVASTRSTSSPKTAVQIAAVRQLLAHWDAIYAPITRENSAVGVHAWRAQQRGVPADAFMHRDGFMISDAPDERAASDQQREYKRLQRIATRESGAAQLVRARRREAAARDAMAREDGASAQLHQWLTRSDSRVIMDLAMIGAATATLEKLVRAVELQATGDDDNPEQMTTLAVVVDVIAMLVDECEVAARIDSKQ